MKNTIEISGKVRELKLTFGSLSFLQGAGVSFKEVDTADPLLLLQSMLLHEKELGIGDMEEVPASSFLVVMEAFADGMGVGLGKQKQKAAN